MNSAGRSFGVITAPGGPPSGAAGGDLSGTYPNPDIGAGKIVDADVNASAAIAKTKLAALDVVNADVNASAAIARSKLDFGSGLVNADVAAAAAIAKTKLASLDVVNADVNSSAAIAYSKLALGTSIVNADVNASAAIAYSKLNLGTSIVNADVNASAAIAESKLALTAATGAHASRHARGGADQLTTQAGDFAPARLGTTATAAENLPRWVSGIQLTPLAGVCYLNRITLGVGSYTTVTMCKSVTQGATLTNTYLGLYDVTSLARLAVSADLSTPFAAVAANTDGSFTMNATISTAGDYYISLLIATAVTMPTLLGTAVGASALQFRTPILAARHNAGSLSALPDPVVASNPGGLQLFWFRYE